MVSVQWYVRRWKMPSLPLSPGKGHLYVLCLASAGQKRRQEGARSTFALEQHPSGGRKAVAPCDFSRESGGHPEHVFSRKHYAALRYSPERVTRRPAYNGVRSPSVCLLEGKPNSAGVTLGNCRRIVEPTPFKSLQPPVSGEALVQRLLLGSSSVAPREQKRYTKEPSGCEVAEKRKKCAHHTLISTSTPLGSSSCMRASTVSLLDDRMSISRL